MSNLLNKVIIPLAGLGTRMLPATKEISKEMLPVSGKPVIHHIVQEAIDSGFSEIIFVLNKNKLAVENYFKKNTELESYLEKKRQISLLKEVKDISKLKTNILTTFQKEPKGLGHAILSAKSLISGEPFAVMLPDMILDSDHRKNNLAKMKEKFDKSGESSILLGRVNKSNVQNYGIAKLKEKSGKKLFFPLQDIIEKPTPQKAPSNLFVVGRYIFDNEILNFLAREKPDSKGEIQLSGAISSFLKSTNIVNGLLIEGEVHDCGSKIGYLIANLAFSVKDKNIKKEVLKYLKK